MQIDIHDIEEFQQHFVKPMVDAVKAEIAPLASRVGAIEGVQGAQAAEIATLKQGQKWVTAVVTMAGSLLTYFTPKLFKRA